MGKKPYRRRSRRNVPGRSVRIAGTVTMGAVGSGSVVKGPITTASTDPYRLKSIKAAYSWSDIQAIIDDAMEFGFAHSDYTAAEVEECLEAQAAIDKGDKVAQERSNRLVRSVGRISRSGAADGSGEVFADGRMTKTKLNWLMSTGDTLDMWARNSSGVVWTTGSFLQSIGSIWIVDSV